ncbi:MAG: hypothetical protein PHW19_03820 [Salinivirgaceae bacterium]|nr:hypothetical protein [Salinivirgaceae bacterium]
MGLRNVILFVIILFSIGNRAYGQGIVAPKDSTLIYKKIEVYSNKSKFSRFIYRLIFKPVDSKTPRKVKKPLIQKPDSTLEGKIIRNINIVTLDPFKNSIADTITPSVNFILKAGNHVHIKSRAQTIRNLLLIRKNQSFDALLAKESERLIRSMRYVTDVRFYVETVPESPDSVDVFIRELDKWSLIPGGSISPSNVTSKLKDNNFLGLGHEFQNKLVWNHSTGKYAYHTKYFVPNIRNTYINSTMQYGIDEDGDFIKRLAVDRPFFSPFAKWAAGVNISQHLHNVSDSTISNMHYKYNQQDYWAGNSFRIFKGDTDYKRTTNFILSARYVRTHFLENPLATVDTLQFYTNEDLYLTSLGVSSRLYVKDKYIFKFGVTEDVPVGKVISLTSGYQKKNGYGRIYMGGQFSAGGFYSWGYMSSNFEYGTFLNASKFEQGVFSIGVNYFTKLIEVGRWKIRQFVKPRLIIGLNRTDYDSLTLNSGYGLEGFNSPLLSGNSRVLFTSQTQLYAPWDFIGFHFGPYVTFSMGVLGSAEKGFQAGKVYSQIGVGVIIKNENLVLNTFQLSLSFYPEIPGKGFNMFKMNAFHSADFGFRDFEIGKPTTVEFH